MLLTWESENIPTVILMIQAIKRRKKKRDLQLDFLATAVMLLVIRIYLTNHYFCQYFSIKFYGFFFFFPSGQLSIMGMHNIQVYFTIALDL